MRRIGYLALVTLYGFIIGYVSTAVIGSARCPEEDGTYCVWVDTHYDGPGDAFPAIVINLDNGHGTAASVTKH